MNNNIASFNMEVSSDPPFGDFGKKRSFEVFGLDYGESSGDTFITPPHSTIRKNKMNSKNKSKDYMSNSQPLSPTRSSPLAPIRAKKQKSEGSSRSNGNLSLDEILTSLEKRKLTGELNKKPPYSYAILICLAILQSPEGKLTLSQIYNWITTHFSFYRPKDSSWQNSIRHNLSLNEAFIKTEKSSDGKGHFWEVKPLSAPKFFKGEAGGYELIREKLSNIEQYFELNDQTVSDDGEDIEDPIDKSSPIFSSELKEESHMIVALPKIEVNDSITGNNRNSSITLNNIEETDENNNGNNNKNFDNLNLEPPYYMKRMNTLPAGVPDLTRDFFGIQDVKSSQNSKRYTCSFNTSFEELSPRPFRNETGSQLSNVSLNIENDILKTPDLKQSQFMEKTPSRLTQTPRDTDLHFRKWQTPSHLFEDIYSSPIFKAMGLSGSTTSGSKYLKTLSPRNTNDSDLLAGGVKSKLSCSGLFGVDVYSVWKRATENVKPSDETEANSSHTASKHSQSDENAN
ncbi:hypothetical protein KAFR_0F02850 [Kazachstania africana CBS 2517]|uniref:Fork-head domain-containing protein n=1 Tax=Kazachstania africana (strain ATCC 22294 / BCRC 22015 / CBS 2517 / CECT 1963 / NBRC 1671 / NRRL Y-8276) TaxID=1071382 RepID=H2AWY1_KAZAF|nr:hypothetical protein KAFR_0F02850 [Kazachstania africana CBS 2517]CCF58881.1 hypothetical protein KAFR_0F02850 [Kazachstania africana CBS 2517]